MDWKRLRDYWPLTASLLTGLLISLSMVPWSLDPLAWIGLIPLLSVLLPMDPEKRCHHPFRWGYLSGLIFWTMTISWIWHVSVLGTVLLVAYLSLYHGIWSVVLTQIRSRWNQVRGRSHCWIALTGASSWVLLEWVRGWMLGGFPWNELAVSQYQNLALIQISEWTGSLGVTFVIMFFNLSMWLTWRRLWKENFAMRSWRYEFSVAIILIFFCLFWGLKQIWNWRSLPESRSLRIALIQPNIPQEVKYEPMTLESQMERLNGMTRVAAGGHPDVIFWPETALVSGPSSQSVIRDWLESLAHETRAVLYFGTIDSVEEGKGGRAHYNAATTFDPEKGWGKVYHKMHLVPFGEYIPLERWLPFIRWFTPIPGSFRFGDRPVLLHIKNISCGTLICFEDALPESSRRWAKEGADLLVNLTNDAWFKESPQSMMHAANAVLRTVETRLPMIRCTNHGQSMMISPVGYIEHRVPEFTQLTDVKDFSWKRREGTTFFVRWGYTWLWGCALIVAMAWSGVRMNKK